MTNAVSQPLHVTKAVLAALEKKYPVESLVLKLMIADGRAILVDDAGAGH